MTHGHQHGHAHNHSHFHPKTQHNGAFALGIALNLAFVVIEIACGWWANSLSLIADAGHNLGDVFGLALAWGASYLVTRPPTDRRTYGMGRSSILAALFNALLLLGAVSWIIWEAIVRFSNPAPVAEGTVIAVALTGVLINGITAWLFVSGKDSDLNIRGAFLHMAADAAISLGVAVTGVVIWLTGWFWLDPVISLGIALVITVGTWSLLREAANLSMDAVPDGIDLPTVRNFLATLPGVSEVHDLHIWAMSTTETALTVHLVMPEAQIDDDFLSSLDEALFDKFRIEHLTIQIENGKGKQPCKQASHSDG